MKLIVFSYHLLSLIFIKLRFQKCNKNNNNNNNKKTQIFLKLKVMIPQLSFYLQSYLSKKTKISSQIFQKNPLFLASLLLTVKLFSERISFKLAWTKKNRMFVASAAMNIQVLSLLSYVIATIPSALLAGMHI